MSTTNPVIPALRQALADSYALLGQTHLAHWNVRGPNFFALHEAFEVQYTELFAAIDELAERLRALGSLAPGGLAHLAEMSTLDEAPEDCQAEDFVRHLVECNEKTVDALAKARDAASETQDPQSEDMMIARIQTHQKVIWMLKSFLA